jgi:hypothetical protein
LTRELAFAIENQPEKKPQRFSLNLKKVMPSLLLKVIDII